MRLISAIGTGLLVGTALIVIIPEGIETLYSAEAQAPSATVLEVPMRGAAAALSLHNPGQALDALGGTREFKQSAPPVLTRSVYALAERAEHGHDHDKEQTSSHAWIGVTLITGFIMMYLIDALPSLSTSPRGEHIPLAPLISDNPSPTTPTTSLPSHGHTHSTTIGLVIHSFADGIALGASSATPATQSSLGLVVFVAILVHKAPAAFGLTSVLLKQGLGKRAARGHLLLFSLAAPLGALVTWAFVNALGVTGSTSDGSWWTGIVLIFSGGTFL